MVANDCNYIAFSNYSKTSVHPKRKQTDEQTFSSHGIYTCKNFIVRDPWVTNTNIMCIAFNSCYTKDAEMLFHTDV